MMNRLKNDLAPLALRLALAVIFMSHGYLKLKAGDGDKWAPDLNPHVALAVAWGELIGGFALAIGLLSRLAALGMGIVQVGAIVLVTGDHEFIVDMMTGRQSGFNFQSVGYEYNFALLTMCFIVMLIGSGMYSLDYLICGRGCAMRSAADNPPIAAQPVVTGR